MDTYHYLFNDKLWRQITSATVEVESMRRFLQSAPCWYNGDAARSELLVMESKLARLVQIGNYLLSRRRRGLRIPTELEEFDF